MIPIETTTEPGILGTTALPLNDYTNTTEPKMVSLPQFGLGLPNLGNVLQPIGLLDLNALAILSNPLLNFNASILLQNQLQLQAQAAAALIPFLQLNSGTLNQAVKSAVPTPSVDTEQSSNVWSEDPHTSLRVKGQIYVVKGVRKKWDGKRFARCCVTLGCPKLAQGATKYCKAHGGGSRCCVDNCPRAARGGSYYCANHGVLRSKKSNIKSPRTNE